MHLQSDADERGEGASWTWRAIGSQGASQGTPTVGYKEFAARWDQEANLPPEQQILRKLVKGFDGRGLTIKTQTVADQPDVQQDAGQSEVSKMAKRATAKAIG